MEFLTQNHINTTTQIAVGSNTALSQYLFGRDPLFQYFTEDFNNDLTTASITFTFDTTTPVSRIALTDINLKEFRLFYNGATANAFTISSGATTTSIYTSNSETSLYLRCATTMVSSITIDMKKTITANEEKVVGQFIASDLYLNLTHIPDSKGYKPSRVPKQVVHTLSDGGTRLHTVRKKYNINISLDYLSQSLRDSLEEIYELRTPFYFCPFGTTTSWDAVIFEAVWHGPFDFYEFSDNASVSGFSGNIKLKETSA